MIQSDKFIYVSVVKQELTCYEKDKALFTCLISTGKNGQGGKKNSLCTPRGWHKIASVIGRELQKNSVLIARKWTGELYSEKLAAQGPKRDWILTRIIQLDGLELGRNKGNEVDTKDRYIYIHGTPDSVLLGKPGSHGCIRMNNEEIIELSYWATTDTLVYIQ